MRDVAAADRADRAAVRPEPGEVDGAAAGVSR